MAGCAIVDRTFPYWPGGRCDLDAPLAEDSPWVVYDNETDRNPVGLGGEGQYAEKVVGAVTITARASGNGSPRFGQPNTAVPAGSVPPAGVPGGMPIGAADHNALTVVQDRVGGHSYANLQFDANVRQPRIGMRVIDVDQANSETLRTTGATHPPGSFGGAFNLGGPADLNVPLDLGVFGSGAGVHHVGGVGGPGYTSVGNASETSAYLVWNEHPWGGAAGPIVTGFVLSPGVNQRASQYDFGGPIFQTECSLTPRFARVTVDCDGEMTLVDTIDGHTLTPAEAATIEGRAL